MMGRKDWDQASLFIGWSLTDTPRLMRCVVSTHRGVLPGHCDATFGTNDPMPAVTQHAAGLFHASFNSAHAFQASQPSLNCTLAFSRVAARTRPKSQSV